MAIIGRSDSHRGESVGNESRKPTICASYTALRRQLRASAPRESSALAPPQEQDPASWHKFFGASANNQAWALVEMPPAEVDRRQVLDAAHAASWHWRQIGDELKRMRALMLLACAHAHMGLGESAMGFAEEMRAYFLARPDTPNWELAFVHAVHAYAAAVCGNVELHARSHALAVQAIASIDEPNRKLVQQVFRHVPAPDARLGSMSPATSTGTRQD